jgi:hypothetical protein
MTAPGSIDPNTNNQDEETMQISDFDYSARRLNNLAAALNAQSYLEIGVETGHTFLNVSCGSKTGVDPFFLFDWQSYNSHKGFRLCNSTSDDFFQNLETSTKYDLVFIDGLHTFEQTYRDIINSLRFSHSQTVFLIDDTVPCDVFSTCRDQAECLSLRSQLLGSSDNRWHGDTYKIVPLLSVFNCDLKLATIVDKGNPQTLLWRPNLAREPDPIQVTQAMWALQNLAAADYLWLLQNFSLYNPVTEDEAIDQVLRSIGPPRQ